MAFKSLRWRIYSARKDNSIYPYACFADSMGILLLYPIYQSWLNGISITKMEIKWIAIISLGLCFLLTLGFTIFTCFSFFFILPLILVLSFNVRIAGVVIISAISFISIVIATALNLGPFITTNQIDTNFRLIAFVFSGALTVLGLHYKISNYR